VIEISREIAHVKRIELASYLPLVPSRSKEFWTKWRILHIRQLAQTGRATEEVWLPSSERTQRVLDHLYLRQTHDLPQVKDVSTKVRFASGYPLYLSSPLYLGDMSFGALSGAPNIALAKAAGATKILAGTGEGGLLKEVAEYKSITIQWASARFGVDISTLRKGQGVVIKIGQGAKPGIGGHLPGVKVTERISQTRRIPAGRDAISPAPHHDIYSIEDLGQRILALKEATGKPVFVKVGATNYIPYIASGIARMGAAGIIIDGAGAGTGAAPTVVKNNVGIPVELAVASVDSILRQEGLRDDFTIIAAGKVSCPEDSLKLIALGADMTSLGTAALLAIGCLMVHKCHLGYCPALLTNKITENQARVLSLDQSVFWLTNLVKGWTEEMNVILRHVGLSDIKELRSRRDLLMHDNTIKSETLEILGVTKSLNDSAPTSPINQIMEPQREQNLWSAARVSMLRDMAGTTGKSPAEVEISSMGAIGPSFVGTPARLSDWLVLDGAQVTRPSIDPYREEIETSTYLSKYRLRLAAPFFFTHLPARISNNIGAIFARTATYMGLLFDKGLTGIQSNKYSERIISSIEDRDSKISSVEVEGFTMDKELQKRVGVIAASGEKILLLRISSSLESLDWIYSNLPDLSAFSGFIVDEGNESSNLQLEVSVSMLDRHLRDEDRRSSFDILAEGNSVRGSDDIFKLLALGADCVGFGKAALIAIGFEEGDKEVVFDIEKSRHRLENLVVALEKDIKLLAGAAGVSSLSSSLVGNRELLRSVNLEPSIRTKLGVKPAGAL
jgi:glutamate synthase domain-containing protein 2